MLLIRYCHCHFNVSIGNLQDVERLHKGLKKSKVTCSPVSNPDFNHLDFLWGRDAAKVVYRDVWTFIEKHL